MRLSYRSHVFYKQLPCGHTVLVIVLQDMRLHTYVHSMSYGYESHSLGYCSLYASFGAGST
jgi:hypothetical protein